MSTAKSNMHFFHNGLTNTFRWCWSCLDRSGPHVNSLSAAKSTAALRKTQVVPRGSQMRISTVQKLHVPTAKPMRRTQTLQIWPGTSEGYGCMRAGCASQGCHGIFFFLIWEPQNGIITFPMQIQIFILGLFLGGGGGGTTQTELLMQTFRLYAVKVSLVYVNRAFNFL